MHSDPPFQQGLYSDRLLVICSALLLFDSQYDELSCLRVLTRTCSSFILAVWMLLIAHLLPTSILQIVVPSCNVIISVSVITCFVLGHFGCHDCICFSFSYLFEISWRYGQVEDTLSY